ncbi:hypothetical protein HNY73_022874 [Argiope bruennichi]|uniref:Uncharacterized protein n=1 Tax=Argiope bruennichi TaxID=94029 RepID=A0A8T0E2A9_ARGBR|nr:hypothetical protein HNY73_022874 [Argiope bruennichi]
MILNILIVFRSANNVVESKTRAKKNVPTKEKNSKKAPTAAEKAASTRKVVKTIPNKKGTMKISSEINTDADAEADGGRKKPGTTLTKARSKKNGKEINKNIKKIEISSTKSEKIGRKRKIEEANEPVNDKPIENKSEEKEHDNQPVKKRTKIKLSSISGNLRTKIIKKSSENRKSKIVTGVKIPVRKFRNPKKEMIESQQNDEDMNLQKDDESKSEKSKVELTEVSNLKLTSSVTKNSNKALKNESITTKKGKKVQAISQKIRNVKKNSVDVSDQNDEDETLKMESSDEVVKDDSESETLESCKAPAKGTKKSSESKTVIKVKKNIKLKSSLRTTRNTKKPQGLNLLKNSEEEKKIHEEENMNIIVEADQPKKNKVEISGRKTRNAKKVEEANSDVENVELLQSNEQTGTGNKKDIVLNAGKIRNFKRGNNKKSDSLNIIEKAFENSVNENKADEDESQSKVENIEIDEKKTRQRISRKKDQSDIIVSTTKLKRGAKVVSNEELSEKSQISTEEENSISDSSDTTKIVPIRKTRRGGKIVLDEESTEQMQFSTEIKDLNEESSNSNLSNMADSAKTATNKKTRRGVKTIPNDKFVNEIQVSAQTKDLDEENNSNLSSATDAAKITLTRKTRRGIKSVSDDKSTDKVQISTEIQDLDEENSNSNLSNISDSGKTAATRKTRRRVKPVSDKKSVENMPISTKTRNLPEENNDSNSLLNIVGSAIVVPTKKIRRGIKAVSGEESNEEKHVSSDTKDADIKNSNSNSVLNVNKTSLEYTLTGRTRSGSVSKQKCDQLALEKKSRLKLQSDMKESLDSKQADESLMQKLQMPAETRSLHEDNNNSLHLSNFATSVSEIKSSNFNEDTKISDDSETVETEQSFMNCLQKVESEDISKQPKAVNVQINKNLVEEMCTDNCSKIIENLSDKEIILSDINSESISESDSKENKNLKVTTEVSVIITREIKSTTGDEKNDRVEVKHKDCNEKENFEELAVEKVLEKNDTEEKCVEMRVYSDDIHGIEHENRISDVNLGLTEVLDQQKEKEVKKSKEVINMQAVETNKLLNEVLKEHENGNKKCSEIFHEKDPEESLNAEISKSNNEVKILDSDALTSKAALLIATTEENLSMSSQKDSAVVPLNINLENEGFESSTKIDKTKLNIEILLGNIQTSDAENGNVVMNESKKDVEITEKHSKEFYESENFQNVNIISTEILGIEKDTSGDIDIQNNDEFSSKNSLDFHVSDGDRNDEKNSDETDSKDSCLNKNKNCEMEFSVDSKIKHATKSLSDFSELLIETSIGNNKEFFHTTNGSNNQIKVIDIDIQEQEETLANQHQLVEASVGIDKQDISFDVDEQSKEICVESNKLLKETYNEVEQLKETCMNVGDLLKEVSFDDKQLKENSILVCEQTAEIVKSDEQNDKTFVSNQCDATFVDNNKKTFSGDNDHADNIGDQLYEASVHHSKKLNEMPLNESSCLDKTTDNINQLNKTFIDDQEQSNSSAADSKDFVKSFKKEYLEEVSIMHKNKLLDVETYVDIAHWSEIVNKDIDLNESLDSNQLSENILIVDDNKEVNKPLVNDLVYQEASVANETRKEVIKNAIQLQDELVGDQLTTEEMVKQQLNEKMVKKHLDAEMVKERLDKAVINDDESRNELLIINNEQISMYGEKRHQLNVESTDNNKELSVDNKQLNQRLADNSKQLSESSADGKLLNESSTNSNELEDLCSSKNDGELLNEVSADEGEQLKETSIDDGECLNREMVRMENPETSDDKKELLESLVNDRGSQNETSTDENEKLEELPVFDSEQLIVSSVAENKQMNESLAEIDKELNETSVDGDALLNEPSISDKQTKESSCDSVQAKESSNSDVMQIKESSINYSVQLKELSTNNGLHLKVPLSNDCVQSKEPSNNDSLLMKESPINNNMQLKESLISDGEELNEISADDSIQLNRTLVDGIISTKETSSDNSIKLDEAVIDNNMLLKETSANYRELNVTTFNHEQLKKPLKECNSELLETSNGNNEQEKEIDSAKFLHTKTDECYEKLCLKNAEQCLIQLSTAGRISDNIADSGDKSKNSSAIQIIEQKSISSDVFRNQSDHKSVSKEFVCSESSVVTSELDESAKEREGRNTHEKNIPDESSITVMSPKNLIICEELNKEEVNKLASSKNTVDRENSEVSETKDTDESVKSSNESVSDDLDQLIEEANSKTLNAENRTDLNKISDFSNKPSIGEFDKGPDNRESSLSTYTKRVDSGTISIVKKDGNRKKTKLIKTTGNSNQMSNDELKMLSVNLEQSSDIVINRKSVKRKSENLESPSLKAGLDSSTEISVAIKIKKKKTEEEESMSDGTENLVRSLLTTDPQSSSDLEIQGSQCRLDPSEPGPSRVETEAELINRKRKATSCSSPTPNEAKKSKVKNSSIPFLLLEKLYLFFFLKVF